MKQYNFVNFASYFLVCVFVFFFVFGVCVCGGWGGGGVEGEERKGVGRRWIGDVFINHTNHHKISITKCY